MTRPAELKAKLDAIREQHKKAAPSMAPRDHVQRRAQKEEEPPPPDIRTLKLTAQEAEEFEAMAAQVAIYARQESEAKRLKEQASARVKLYCEAHHIRKVTAAGLPVSYYSIARSHIDRVQLLAHDVSKEVIEDCTVTNTSWALRVGKPQRGEE